MSIESHLGLFLFVDLLHVHLNNYMVAVALIPTELNLIQIMAHVDTAAHVAHNLGKCCIS